MRKALPISCLLWLGMAGSVFGAQVRPQSAAPLFTDLPSAIAPRAQSSEVVRSRPVRIALESLAEADRSQAAGVRGRGSVQLNLFPDVEVTAVLKEVTPTDIGFAWVGTLAGIPESHVTLVYGKGILMGNITLPGSAYRVMYTPAGIHVIEEVDPTAFPPELDPIPVPESDGDFSSVTGELETVTAQADSGATFDVLVLYTTTARTAAGGTAAIQNLINLGVSETNTAYANSGIIPRLNLVHSAEVSYTESGDLSTDLARLKNPADGYMDSAHSLRNTYGADLVKLVVSTSAGGACGVAYLMCGSGAGFESSAFSVTARNCISPNYTFGHELGHNMGSNHAPDDPTGCGAFSYSFGYKDPQSRFRTVMAYDCGASCPRVLRFSNPNLFYNGWVTGTSTQNNALSINNVRTVVANFRPAANSVSQVYPPTGWVDGFDQQYIWGWACDPDYPTQSNRVDIYTTSWQYLGSANANLSSSAPINSACRGGSAHYFSFYHNGGVPPGTHFMVWTIDLPYNTPGNDNRRLAGTGGINGGTEFVMPVSVSQAYAPTGWVDGYDRQHIWGWACDPDYPTQSNRVDIYTTSWQYLGSADANLSSSAPINSACRGGSAHYFDFRHNGSIPPGTHFMVWSIDLPYNTPGNDNRRISGTGGIGGNEFVVP